MEVKEGLGPRRVRTSRRPGGQTKLYLSFVSVVFLPLFGGFGGKDISPTMTEHNRSGMGYGDTKKSHLRCFGSGIINAR